MRLCDKLLANMIACGWTRADAIAELKRCGKWGVSNAEQSYDAITQNNRPR
jgi:hypothetical protein